MSECFLTYLPEPMYPSFITTAARRLCRSSVMIVIFVSLLGCGVRSTHEASAVKHAEAVPVEPRARNCEFNYQGHDQKPATLSALFLLIQMTLRIGQTRSHRQACPSHNLLGLSQICQPVVTPQPSFTTRISIRNSTVMGWGIRWNLTAFRTTHVVDLGRHTTRTRPSVFKIRI